MEIGVIVKFTDGHEKKYPGITDIDCGDGIISLGSGGDYKAHFNIDHIISVIDYYE